MGILAYGTEGEMVPNDLVLTTTHADENSRGHEAFAYTEFSQVDLGVQALLWVGGKCIIPYVPMIANSLVGQDEFFCIKDASSNVLVSLFSNRVGNPGFHNLYIQSVDGDATALVTQFTYGIPPTVAETAYAIEISLTGTDLYFAVYIGGSKIFEKTINGVTPAWAGPALFAWGGYGPDETTLWREITASDEPILGNGLSTLEATAAGFHTSASGDYTDVAEEGVDLTTTLNFAVIGDKESWTVAPLAGKVFDSTAIQGLLISFLASLTNPLINGLRPFVRAGGVDYPGADTLVPAATMGNVTYLMTVNPATGVQFTPAELTAGVEIGLEAV